LEAAFNFHNLSLGLTVFFLARVLGILYFVNSIDDKEIHDNAFKQLWYNAIPFVVFFLTFTIWLLLRDGFAYDAQTKTVAMEPFKYANNLVAMPLVAIVFLLGVVAVLYGIITALFLKRTGAIWFSGAGTVATVFALFLVAGYNNTSFYPSTADLQSSLTIENASSSHFTLTAMSYVSLFIPVVVAYIWYVWKALNKTRIDKDEMDSKENHIY
jgi:cytochrome d ubiquinol oxidase subunit II